MTMDRRAMLAATLGTLALGACHGQTKAGLEGITLRVWRHKLAASRFMEAAGLPPTPYQVAYADLPGGQMVLNAFSGDGLDYAFMSQIPPVYALRSGVPIKLVATYAGDTHNGGILVNRGSSARRIEDLRGRTVTYVPGTNDHFYLLKLLDRHGLSIKDIQPVPLSALDANAAFQSGHVEACTTSNLPALQLEAMGGRWLSRDLAGIYAGNFVIAAHTGSLADPVRRSALADYLRREQATWNWVARHPHEWARLAAKLTGAPIALFERLAREQSRPGQILPISDAVIRDQQEISDFLVKEGLLQSRQEVHPLWMKGLL